ncbi:MULTISPECIES: AzlD domain-containing protein [unclassified Actinopolyspora]|uniref:AzlD domain-containing protein n=1 Tax=Actinopolyspora TaxID=1849 RepID=UPI0013F67494|nr:MULTISPECIES: AzlD domain-containing protein [unclassified Actinopolyspora]NHD17500.1 AzlD domain-containing protein [Actinopolyspora sp. BKK2]NHE76767.1 AzlD domain-containing protein [Actinopolyspora sp. BKK1]
MNLGIVVALAAGTYALRVAGPLLRGRLDLPEEGRRMLSTAALVLLGAFVVTSTLYESGTFAGVARLAGVVAGGVLAWRRAPFVVVVLAAAGVTAGLRALLDMSFV